MSLFSYQIARVWGIPIRLNISLVILFAYLANTFSPDDGILLGIGFLFSIVLHELGHAYVAQRKGCRVRKITLMVVGGAAQMDRLPERPRDEFLVAIAGPLVSLAVGLIVIPLGRALSGLPVVPAFGTNLVETIGWANIGLFGFNLLPAFPMDGGRILRAALTPRFGRLRATASAARLGQLIAIALAVYGWSLIPRNHLLVLVAVFVFFVAGQELRFVRLQEALRQGRHPLWPFFGQPPFGGAPAFEPPGGDDDRVIISPPPYARGPASEADVHPGNRPPIPFRE